MSNKKTGFVSVIGRPNVGKSTLLNQILKEKLVITSKKPQTTRNAIRCIYNDSDSQMIFIDTPGMTRPKNKLGDFMQKSAVNALKEVEAIVYMIEPETKFGPTDRDILKILSEVKETPIILVINKIDTVEKEKLLKIIEELKDYPFLEAIIPISALKDDGVEILIEKLKEVLPEGPEYFPTDMIIDQSERFVFSELIREKILKNTDEEIPHGTAVEILSVRERENSNKIDIQATILCERKSHKKILIGKGGSMLKKIGREARKDIEFFLKQPVNLELWVKVKENWRNRPLDLSSLGYKD